MSLHALQWEPVPRPAAQGVGVNILVAEDDAADRYLIGQALRHLPRVGLVEFARDGVEALELLDGNWIAPDLAIIDLKMPRMDGFRLLVEMGVRSEGALPIVVLTSSRARNDAVRSLFRGAARVLVKPDSAHDLEKALGEVIGAI